MSFQNKEINDNIFIKDLFTVEKMEDIFVSVTFKYDNYIWDGAIPIKLIYQGIDKSEDNEDKIEEYIVDCYRILDPSLTKCWYQESENYWREVKNNRKGQTYDVLQALLSGEWECRVCGPVPKVNPQSSARLRDLKKMGYVISSKRKTCGNCNSTTTHDILVKLPMIKICNSKERYGISSKLATRIKQTLGNREVCFDVIRDPKELLIDHKFPSQRWYQGETPNPDDMSNAEIRNKFQLLVNQTNMWKSRYCDRCVQTGIRGDYMGINWYPVGDKTWQGEDKYDERGCIGCPWYDLDEWRRSLNIFIEENQ